VEAGKNSLPDPKNYDCVIMGASIYIGSWLLKKWLARHAASLKESGEKKLFAFTVSGELINDERMQGDCIERVVPQGLRDRVSFFHFPGALDMNALKFSHRMIVRAVLAAKAKEKSSGESAGDTGIRAKYDDVRRECIAPLVAAVRSR
jgi:menaquinone-dependent protoporphyrinogen IX oxidase